ncbi:class I SAM-dependent methyltransferase [Niveispirillum sp.]|uniref:class I SAM-dependent DNA methyltransferase n=1 Tax=Niveispirillum sp. TaxID=1917217 RepID=UPI001B604DC8|nr:class I SAM-dependent methyltransferase [Niveispirillum sp.]MBP7337820.1 class I SAM-dependent methyltransferase [Niveispirillum sp.]
MTDHDQTLATNQAGYDRWARLYDRYPNPTVAADELAFPPLWSHLRGLNVLEIGCGTGRHTLRLARAGNRVTGVDLSAGMLAQARAKLSGFPVTLIQGDVMAGIEIPGLPFDAALTALVIEHIGDLAGFFRRVHDLLRPGGAFYISEIHPDRTAAGTFAHFRDEDGTEVALAGYPHCADGVEAAARAAGLILADSRDVKGDEALAALNPKWERHKGRNMLKIWVLRRPVDTSGP